MIITPIAIDGKYFTNYNVGVGFAYGDQSGPNRNPIMIARADDVPAYGGMRQEGRRISIDFTVNPGTSNLNDVGYTLRNLLAMLQPGNSALRTLVAELADGPDSGAQYELQVSVGQYRYTTRNGVIVDFWAPDDRWQERLPTALPTLSFDAPLAVPLLNHGGTPANPVITFGVTSNRSTDAADLGWKYRRSKSISNGGDRNWNRVRLTIDLGDTAAWVTAGKALANGDDVRIRFQGRELNRTLTNFNTKRTWLHFFATIPAGGSATYEIVYGNPSAGSPTSISARGGISHDTYAADDLEGYSGTATSGSTTTMVDSGASWETDRWAGGFVTFTSGTGSVRTRRILSNTGDTLTLNRAVVTAPTAGTTYVIWKSGIFKDGGRVTGKTATTITDTAHTTKWAPNSLAGATVTFIAGSGADPAVMTVDSNTTDTITFTTAFSTQPAVNDQYEIERYGVLNYQVNKSVVSTAQRGLWRTNKYSSSGGRVRFGDQTPGGWIPWLMVDNQDLFSQLRVTDETAGSSVSNWPYLNATRAVRSDRTLEESGQADGVALYDPRGLVSMRWDYRMENDHGIGMVVVMVQEPGGDDWQIIASDSTTRGSLTAVTSGDAAGAWSLIGSLDPVRLYLGVIPANGVTSEIASSESINRTANVRNHTTMIVYLSVAQCGSFSSDSSIWTVGSEVEIYDLNVTGRIGGENNTAQIPPFDTFAIGGDGHYVHIELDQLFKINTLPDESAPLFGIYSSTGVLVQRTPWAGVIEHHEYNLDAADTSLVPSALLPLPPAANMVANEDNITNWGITNSSGVTATLANDTGNLFDDGTTSLSVVISATPAGAWTITLDYQVINLIPGTIYGFGFARLRSGLTSAETCQMTVDFTATGGISTAGDGPQTIGGVMSTTEWFTAGQGNRAYIGSAIADPTTEAWITIQIAGTGSTSGVVYLDAIALGVPVLYLDEEEIGNLDVDIEWIEGVYA